jgi:hypothetical protein
MSQRTVTKSTQIIGIVLTAGISILLASSCSTDSSLPLASEAPRVSLSASFDSSSIVPDKYIIVFKQSQGLEVESSATAMVRPYNGRLAQIYRNGLLGFSATLTPAAVEEIRKQPDVDFIEPVVRGKTATVQAAPVNWGLDRLDQYQYWSPDHSYTYVRTGAGVRAYLLDSGINYANPEYGGRAIFGADFVTVGGDGSDCDVVKQHGSMVAGIVGSTTYGVAKGVTLVSVKIANCSSVPVESDVAVQAINWVTAHAVKPAVANISSEWGVGALFGPPYAINNAIQTSISSGVVWVVASGNDNGNTCETVPGGSANAITVGASTASDYRWPGTNVGYCLDIWAPGENITSTGRVSGTTNTNSGTSIAAPFVTGVAALYLEGNTLATPAQVATAINIAGYPYAIANPSINGWSTTARMVNIEPFYPSPGALTVSITGKSSVKPNQTCTWRASVQGASGTVEYRWFFAGGDMGVSLADSIVTMLPNSGTLSVQVTRLGGSQYGTASKAITVQSTGSLCAT